MKTLKVYKDSPSVGDVAFINEKEKVTKLFKTFSRRIRTKKKDISGLIMVVMTIILNILILNYQLLFF